MFHFRSFQALHSAFGFPALMGIAMLACAVLVSGCVNSTDVRRQETAVLEKYEKNSPSLECAKTQSTDGYNNRVCFAADLARTYISLADKASQSEEFAAYGTIAAAGTAAGALAYGAHLDVIKGAGLAAGTIAVSRNYAQPGETAGHLLDAADGLLCIAKVGRTEGARSIPNAATMIDDAIDTIRVDLRRKLTRRAPDYQAIMKLLKSASKPDAEAAIEIKMLKTSYELEVNLDACVLEAMKGAS